MRRFCLFGTLLLLVAGLILLWQHRFERSGAYPVFALADLAASAGASPGSQWKELSSGPAILLKVDDQHRNVVARLAFPGLGPVDFLRVRYVVASKGLLPGKELWEDGRGIIEWHAPGRSAVENDPFFSTRHDLESERTEFVMRPRRGPALPVLRLENLGTAGEMQVREMEVVVLKERWTWKTGRWLLMAGWIAWLFAWMRPAGGKRRAGPLVTAVAWLFMGLYFVVPGPWKSLHALGPPFSIRAQSVTPLESQAPAAPPVAQADAPETLEAVGEIPPNGDITLTIKLLLAGSKWILHVPLLFAPVLLTACLAGRRPALTLGILFSFAVEAAQIGFGFGCDATDLVDLAADAAGILLALAVHHGLASIIFTRMKAPAFFATA
ncbi:MAG: hypothetical protein EOP88_09210 [Verrucomicrobiaceae bacterium]|nr:MAG: hypothetical protein EOP88_09210 [Verrucomicrobiaceae bacterium]